MHERNHPQTKAAAENAIVPDIHILNLTRCVRLPSMLADAVHIREPVPLYAERRVPDAKQEFEYVARFEQ